MLVSAVAEDAASKVSAVACLVSAEMYPAAGGASLAWVAVCRASAEMYLAVGVGLGVLSPASVAAECPGLWVSVVAWSFPVSAAAFRAAAVTLALPVSAFRWWVSVAAYFPDLDLADYHCRASSTADCRRQSQVEKACILSGDYLAPTADDFPGGSPDSKLADDNSADDSANCHRIPDGLPT